MYKSPDVLKHRGHDDDERASVGLVRDASVDAKVYARVDDGGVA